MFRQVILRLLFSVTILISGFPSVPAQAASLACVANVAPHRVLAGSTTDYLFNLNNTGSSAIKWARFTRPSSNYSIQYSTISGWNHPTSENAVVLVLGTLNSGSSLDLGITASVVNAILPPASWIVEASTVSSGAGAVRCSGDTSTETYQPTGATISNVSVSQISQTSAIINWNTNVTTTGQVSYGLTSQYGSVAPVNASSNSHNILLNGLSPGSTYHFSILARTSDNMVTTTSDNTFATLETAVTPPPPSSPPPPPPAPSTPSQTGPSPLPAPIPVPGDSEAPKLTITTSLNGVYATPPTIKGTASDNNSIARIEYSMDRLNWLPVDKFTTIKSGATFEFTPSNLEEGDYTYYVRALDGNINSVVSNALIFTLDRIAPKIGGIFMSAGPMPIAVQPRGMILTQAGLEQKITLSAVGGPNQIQVVARPSGNASSSQTFSLGQNQLSGLWSGVMIFREPGYYNLTATAVDGAGNRTTKELGRVQVAFPVSLIDQKTKKVIPKGTVTVHNFDYESQDWQVWDGAGYNQTNPIHLEAGRSLSMLLPAGRYYITASSPGYTDITSNIFEITHPTPLSPAISLDPRGGIGSGKFSFTLPSLSTKTINIFPDNTTTKNDEPLTSLIGKSLPPFTLNSLYGKATSSTSFANKPTVLVFFSSWSPAGAEQLSALNSPTKNSTVNIVPIAVQQNSGRLRAYQQMAGYKLNPLLDTLGDVASQYEVSTVPTSIFLTGNGTVKKVMVEVLSKEEIIRLAQQI